MALFSKFFKSYSEKQIRLIKPLVEKVNALGDKYAAMTDSELCNMTVVFREMLASGKTLDEILRSSVRQTGVFWASVRTTCR